ncbi:MAG: T9SS type A sorting domain-containing protein [Parafilimonas sp.]
MKTILRPRLMIMCLIILPFISMAQKKFKQSEIQTKKTLNFRTASLNSSASVSTEMLTESVMEKITKRLSLPAEKFRSPLLPASLSGNSTSANMDDASLTEKTEAASTSPAPIKAFKGSKEKKNLYPVDPNGAAGPDYVMQVNNQEYVISDKSGGLILSLTVDQFWSGFDGVAKAFAYPHIEYDPILKHFYIVTLGEDIASGNYAVLFGASSTSDPTGNWTLYELPLGPDFIQDAPQMGYSKRWFTISTMQFDTASPNNFNSSGVYLMSISNLIAGNLSSIYSLNDVNFFSMSPVETQDAGINNHYLISNLGSSTDSGFLYVVHIAGPAVAPTYNYDGYVTDALPWSTNPVLGSQNGTTNQIYLGNTKLTGAVYTNGQIWTSHTVYLPVNNSKTTAVQWWQINGSTLGVTQVGRVMNKSGNILYAYPSLAVNKHNDVLLGYNQFSATTYPSAAYSYRNGSDAVNTMRNTKIYKKGRTAYFDGGASGVTYYWGSYTATSLDPADSSFWTIQEYAEAPANKWGTWWAHVGDVSFAGVASTPVPAPTANKLSSILISPNPANSVASINWSEEKSTAVKIQITNNQGSILLTKEFSAQKGTNKISLNIANLISGVYSVAIFNGTDIKKAQFVVE